jgi:acetyl esterase
VTSPLRRRRLVRLLAAALLALCAGAVGPAQVAEAAAPAPSTAAPRLLRDLQYVADGTAAHRLDACVPRGAARPRPAVVIVHGGSFTGGDKGTAGVRTMCLRLARAGYVAFSVNYRLLPAAAFPDALHDLQHAVRWIRSPDRIARFHVDPARIGAFGESAGAVLVAENGTRGHGSVGAGARFRAVVGLSTATTFELDRSALSPDARRMALQYLGCDDFTGCAAARRASALRFVDRSDPAFLLAASRDDWLPARSSTRLVAALRRVHVPAAAVVSDGRAHGMQLLDDALMRRVLRFYARHL